MPAAALRPVATELPEWRRSGHFVLLAIILHGLALAWPIKQAFNGEPPQPLPALNVEFARPEPPMPIVAPAVTMPPAPTRRAMPPKASTAPHKPPVIAMVSAQANGTPPAFAAPAAPAAPVAIEHAAPPTPPVATTGVRYNAAYLNNPEPKYPPVSRRLGEEGKVLLKVRVTPEGLPAAVELEKSSNFERLDTAARDVVTRWRFVPARRGDQPVEASVIVPIVFRLEG